MRGIAAWLAPRGRYVGFEPSPASLIGAALLNPFRRQKHFILVSKASAADAGEIGRAIAAREIVAPPFETVALADAARAFERVERGGVIGKVVIRVGS